MVALLLPGAAIAAPTGPEDAIVSLQFENDLFGNRKTDHDYTHGTRFSYLSGPTKQQWIKDLASKIPYFVRDEDNADIRVNLSLGQSIFTPDDITVPTPQPKDRPYAGWLYGGAGVISRGVDDGGSRLGIKRLELDVGFIGPIALARESQTVVHSAFGFRKPKGWGNQLPNEFDFVFYGERLWGPYDLLPPVNVPVLGELRMDIAPHIGGALGTVFTYAATGLTLRLGTNLHETWSPPRIRPSLPGAEFYEGDGVKGYIFAAGEVRAVARNIFLDGATFTSTQSVKKQPVVFDAQVGFTLVLGPMQLSFTNIFRTREYNEQPQPDDFGAVSVSFAL
jgi:lipid A 3-O-deacylase